MKTIFPLCLALLAASAAQAEIFRPQRVNSAEPGRPAQVHRSRGGDSGHRLQPAAHVSQNHGRGYRDFGYSPWRYGHSRWDDRLHRGHAHVGYGRFGYSHFPSYRYGYVPSFGYYSGYGYGYPYYDTYGHYGSGYGYYGSGSAATNGLLLGALAGGIIGHNSADFRHSAWRGSAWGAGLGWLLGSVVDANRRSVAYAPEPVVVQQAPAVQMQAQSAAPAQPQQVTIINNYYNSSTPMTAANGMFGR